MMHHDIQIRITAVRIAWIVLRTAVTSSEIEIETHQKSVANVVFTRQRRSTCVDDAGVFLGPRPTGTRAHNGIPAISNRPSVEISGIDTNRRICLLRHAIEFVFTDGDPSRSGVVMAFDKTAVP